MDDTPDAPMMVDSSEDETDIEFAVLTPDARGRSYWRSYKFAEVLLCFVPVPIGAILEFGHAYQRPIPFLTLDEIGVTIKGFMYNNENKGETVSSVLMLFLAIVIPFLLQILLIFYSTPIIPFDKIDAVHKTVCVYFMSIGLTGTLTNVAKLYCGYLRPIFFDLCEFDEDSQECSIDKHQARVSFPSGHSSLSVCGLLVFSLFLEDTFGKTAYRKKWKRDQPQGTVTTTNQEPIKLHRILSVLCYTPMCVAYFIVLSRVHDDRHHPADVVGGSLLGGTIAVWIFDIWFR